MVDTTFKMNAPNLAYSAATGQFYYMLGFSSRNQLDDPFSISDGLISSSKPDEYGRIRGTSGSSFGYLGGGCFCRFTGALLAANVGCDNIPINDNTTSHQMVSRYATKAEALYGLALMRNK